MIDNVMAWFAAGGWVFIPLWCLVMSLVAFIAYRIDKSAAVRGDWRIKESTLHTFELLGGWPGAFLAQRMLHHKNRKVSYQVEFFILLVINVGVLAYIGYRLVFVEAHVVWTPSQVMSWIESGGMSTFGRNEVRVNEQSMDESPRGSVSIRFSR